MSVNVRGSGFASPSIAWLGGTGAGAPDEMEVLMISVGEARSIILEATRCGPIGSLPLSQAAFLLLAESPIAQVDDPPFDHAAMDGFAVNHFATLEATADQPCHIPIAGTQTAGAIAHPTLPQGAAVRIATGAVIPIGATTVIPKEEVEERPDLVMIYKPSPEGAHIRRQAEVTTAGESALPVGTQLTPAAIGYLAGLGIGMVRVYLPPTVGIVPTGTELTRIEHPLAPGQRYDSNSPTLTAALAECHVTPYVWPPVADEPERLRTALAEALERCDIVLITGGVSVGNADYVKPLLADLDVETCFWSVRQKPGKPFYFGRRSHRLVFGLPGNPVSTLVCFYEYVRPAIRRRMGHSTCGLVCSQAVLETAVTTDGAKTHFVRAHIRRSNGGWTVSPLGIQESHRMQAFAIANALIIIPEETNYVPAGHHVAVHWLPPFAESEVV